MIDIKNIILKVNVFFNKNRQNDIWKEITLHNSLYEVTENRLWTLLLKAVIIFFVVSGGMGCYLSAMQIEYYPFVVYTIILVMSVYSACLYYNKMTENIGYLLLFFVVVMTGYHLRAYINSGVFAVFNDFADKASDYFASNAMRNYGESVANRPKAITVAMSYVGIAITLLMNVAISRRMRYWIIPPVMLMVLFMPLYMRLEPKLIYVVFLLIGFFTSFALRGAGHFELKNTSSVYSLKNKNQIRYTYSIKNNFRAMVAIFCVVLVITAFFATIIPSAVYQQKRIDSVAKLKTRDTFENLSSLGLASLFNFYPNIGGLTGGKLGGINRVTLDYNTDLTLTYVPHSTERFYLRNFIGVYYQPFRNNWNSDRVIDMETAARFKQHFEIRNSQPDPFSALYGGDGRSAMAKIKVKNVEAPMKEYLPYYSTDSDKIAFQGREQVYTYYPPLRDNKVYVNSWDYYDGMYRSIPQENLEAIQELCKNARLDECKSDEEIIKRLSAYYQENIPYTYQPGATPWRTDFINYFLQKNRKGYCAHFASAAVLAFRNMGIPARYCEGYVIDPSQIAEDGEILNEAVEDYYTGDIDIEETAVIKVDATDADAHAWVEVYLVNKGWVVADVTPAMDGEEEIKESVWQRFLNFLGSSEYNIQFDESNPDESENIKASSRRYSRVGKMMLNIIAVLVFVVAVVISIILVVRSVIYHYRLKNSGINDRLIMEYQRFVRKISMSNKAFRLLNNYNAQINWLAENQILVDCDASDIINVLEKAGFSNKEISNSEYELVYGLLKNIRRKVIRQRLCRK